MACNAARELSDTGAPLVGGDPWQLVQYVPSVWATPQGRSLATPASEGPASTPPSDSGGGPASFDDGMQLPAGIPAFTHDAKLVICVEVALAYGDGGIGEALSWIRASASTPLLSEGWVYEGALSAARLSSRVGAPLVGTGP